MTNFIERLKNQLQNEYICHDYGGIYELSQIFMGYNSNKIEGGTLTEEQTASIFETGTVSGDGVFFRTKDIEEMTGHFTMFNHMLKTYNEPLSEDLIKRYHYMLKAGVFEDMANGYPVGEYKNRRNIVSNITTSLPQDVPMRMASLIEDYESTLGKDLKDIARLHSDFEKIHPFQDGNGRVGRMLIYKECLRQGVCQVILTDERRPEYYHALNAAQNQGNFNELYQLFEEEQEKYFQMARDFLPPEEQRSSVDISDDFQKNNTSIDFYDDER